MTSFRYPSLRTLFFLTVLAACGAHPARALDVEEVRWGFDEKVKPYDFNLLSILVSNPTPRPFEGSLQIQRVSGGGGRVGAALEEPVFVSPFTSRWVQFYPYIMGEYDDWRLSWLPGGQGVTLNAPPVSKEPARVLLEASGFVAARGGSIKRFPEELFPPMSTATSSLGAVVLDHAPRWEQPRRQAFLDWLRGGGVVHLIYGPDRNYPAFPPSLADLQSPLEMHRVGQGFVYHHPRTRGELNRSTVESIFAAGRPPEQAAPDDEAAAEDDQFNAQSYYYNYGDWNSDGGFFGHLKQMTRVRHNWGLIYLMAFVYILLIFPGCYVLGRLRVDYRLVTAALLASVALFSLGFLQVGRRGYGESTTVNAVAIARVLEDGTHDVRQWSNVFVTGGDDYTIRHAGDGRLYSTCQEFEAVNGVITSGRDGQFLVDIPPFSSRTFAHRARLPGQPLSVAVDDWQAGEKLERLTLSVGETFPSRVDRLYVLYRDRFYTLSRDGDQLQLKTNIGSVPGFLRMEDYDQLNSFVGPFGYDYNDDRTPEERFRAMLLPLIARDLGVSDEKEIEAFSLPPDHLRLFAYAPMPPEFFAQNDRFVNQNGYVLYRLDIIARESP